PHRRAEAGHALEVRRIDDALVAKPTALGVEGHLVAGVEDAERAAYDLHSHRLADEPPGHAVGVGVDLDRAVRAYLTHDLARLLEGRLAVERTQGRGFRSLKAHERRLAGRAVDAHVGHLARPASEVRLEGSQLAKERPAMALRLTKPTLRSSLPFVRAR